MTSLTCRLSAHNKLWVNNADKVKLMSGYKTASQSLSCGRRGVLTRPSLSTHHTFPLTRFIPEQTAAGRRLNFEEKALASRLCANNVAERTTQ